MDDLEMSSRGIRVSRRWGVERNLLANAEVQATVRVPILPPSIEQRSSKPEDLPVSIRSMMRNNIESDAR